MKNGGIVYIITNKNRTVLYIGVTNDIKRRMYEHKKDLTMEWFDEYGELKRILPNTSLIKQIPTCMGMTVVL